jgi:hypothetical protein
MNAPSFSSGRVKPTERNGESQEKVILDKSLRAKNTRQPEAEGGCMHAQTYEALCSGTTVSSPNAGGAGGGCHGFFIVLDGRRDRKPPTLLGLDNSAQPDCASAAAHSAIAFTSSGPAFGSASGQWEWSNLRSLRQASRRVSSHPARCRSIQRLDSLSFMRPHAGPSYTDLALRMVHRCITS